MMMNVAIVVACFIALLLTYAATRPGSLNVERSASIAAPPDEVFALINDFHKWDLWSPWEKLDPQMNKTFSGALSGVGSVYEWSGNKKAGQGRMEIIDASNPGRVTIKLDFIKPFAGHNVTTFTMTPSGGSTNVNWKMTGPSAFMMKLVGVFMDMDKLVGADFENGLANLKRVAESL